jgi:TolB-like protein/tetratricopeptide (TPR) repeat protein
LPPLEILSGTWRFGVYEVDTRRMQLRRNGVTVKLREQPFRILIHLLENAGQVVSREDLRRLLWPADTFVDFDHSLNTAVMKVRNVLGDPAGAPMYVETIPKRGYRFIAPVVFEGYEPPPLAVVQASAEPTPVKGEFLLAVLPFKCTGSTGETNSFAEGLTEEIAAGLARFGYLRVVRGENGARYFLDGALRQAGSKLRTTVRLVDSTSGETLWTETYEQPFEPDALFDLQDYLVPRVVSTIADCRGILPRSIGEALRSRDTDEMEPGHAVFRTCAYLDRMSAEEHAIARTSLERATQTAPGDAQCWAMLALVYKDEFARGFNPGGNSSDRAFAAAQRAVETGPNNHLSYLAFASTLFFRKDFQAFRAAADRALELNPIDGFSIGMLGALIAYSGEWGLGCALAERAHDLNPHRPGRYWFGHLFNAYRKRDYTSAVEIATRIDMPQFWQTHLALAAAMGQLGEIEKARDSLNALEGCWPGFRAVAQDELSRWWDKALVEHLLEGIRKAESDQVSGECEEGLFERKQEEAMVKAEDELPVQLQASRPYLAIVLSVLFAIVVVMALVLVRRFT